MPAAKLVSRAIAQTLVNELGLEKATHLVKAVQDSIAPINGSRSVTLTFKSIEYMLLSRNYKTASVDTHLEKVFQTFHIRPDTDTFKHAMQTRLTTDWWARPVGENFWYSSIDFRVMKGVAEAYLPTLKKWAPMDGLSCIRGDEPSKRHKKGQPYVRRSTRSQPR